MSHKGIDIDRVEAVLGYRFKDRDLAACALTHRSYINENADAAALGHNERLEFLGDAVLGFITADRLYREVKDAREGELTRRRAAYVSEVGLSARVAAHGLGDLVRMGRGQRNFGGAKLPSIVADATEALIAAVYLDGGLDAARDVVERILGEPPADAPVVEDPKSELQHRIQRVFGEPPDYRAERAGGPDHEPVFVGEVQVRGVTLAQAEGSNVKRATRAAAQKALDELRTVPDDTLKARVGAG